MTEFTKFPKIARYSREVIVTEKIDGTNVQIFIGEDGEFLTGSRKRWITPGDDHFGFSAWAHEHKEELMLLGPGRHSGEWWGAGIQRNYGLVNGDRRFSLFNVVRWCLHGKEPGLIQTEDPRVVHTQDVLPPCVGLIPMLWRGCFDALDVYDILSGLRHNGSRAVPGFDKPEGIVIFHTAAGTAFKKTLENDDEPKSKVRKVGNEHKRV